MPRNAKSPSLSRRQRQIMDILFARGQASAAQVLADLPDPPSYSAIRALLKILEDRGLIRHREEGERYIYVPVQTREKAARSALQQLLSVFFAGSLEKALATRLTDPSVKFSEEEFARLTALIEEARTRGD